jgi:5-hydroxyisourate hydrolase
MSRITTHVLDTARGQPAAGLRVVLDLLTDERNWKLLGKGTTDPDGRVRELLPADFQLVAGTYRLRFDTQAYFSAQSTEGFYPEVRVVFTVRDPTQHHHVPLLLSPYGYSTYRGS